VWFAPGGFRAHWKGMLKHNGCDIHHPISRHGMTLVGVDGSLCIYFFVPRAAFLARNAHTKKE
jgi:hypothetical protein